MVGLIYKFTVSFTNLKFGFLVSFVLLFLEWLIFYGYIVWNLAIDLLFDTMLFL